MKKFLVALLCAVLSMFTFTACNKEKTAVTVYIPDGAPALAAAQLMSEDNLFDREVKYEVVQSATIKNYVTGENPQADLCILPVNLAGQLLGSGEVYKMLGTVTHGNLFLLKKSGGEDITADNLESLKGKTVGIINIAAIPGITFKLILNDNGIAYNELGNSGEKVEDKVNLKAVDATVVLPTNEDCDYFVVPEPAASAKVKGTKNALSFAGNLQTLYGGESGYPQAVLVAKNTLIENSPEFIDKFIKAMADNANWIASDDVSPETIVNAIQAHLSTEPTFNANNLTKTVIENCAIKFIPSSECKTEVNTFIDKLIAVNPSFAKVVSDNFFYVK